MGMHCRRLQQQGVNSWCFALILGLALLAGGSLQASPAPLFDLAEFRLRIASDRAAGLAEGRAAIDAGAFRDDPIGKRTLLWFMGGAAVGSADDAALEQIIGELTALAESRDDAVARSLAGFLRGARLLDLGELGEGLVEVLTAANAVADSEDASVQRIATGELCRSYSSTSRLDQALVHCRRHTRLVRDSGDVAAVARAEYLEASVLSYRGEHDQAIALWQSARQRFVEAGLQGLADRTAGSLASDLLALGQFESALEMGNLALASAEASGSEVSIGIAGGYVAEALIGLGRHRQAIEVAERCLAAIEHLAHPSVEAGLLGSLASALRAAEDEPSARLAEVENRLKMLSVTRPPSPEQSDAINTLELQVRQRSLDLRIRELEQQAEIKALALQAAQLDAEKQQAALRNQRVVTGMVVVASIALLAALLTLALLLRSQRRLAASLHAHAYSDSLTSLPNRRAFSEAATTLLSSEDAGQRAHALLLIDIDHFKAINDRGGHPFGDEVLIATAACLRQQVPRSAALARLGGEEFVVLCPGQDRNAALALAERLRLAISAQAFQLAGETVSISISIGVAVIKPGAGIGLAAWLKAADLALYRAKETGRNRVALADPMQT